MINNINDKFLGGKKILVCLPPAIIEHTQLSCSLDEINLYSRNIATGI